MAEPAVKITVLGSGTSTGVPTIGCHCDVCTSADPRDNRLRPSILISYDGHHVLIDVTPDFRAQALRTGFERLDAILFTHEHADHIMGLDDVRPFNFRQRERIPIYASERTMGAIHRAFRYIFDGQEKNTAIPQLESRTLNGASFDLFGLEFTPIPILHGQAQIYGFRFGHAAYLTDHSEIPAASLDRLRGLDVLFLDALRYKPHPTHSTVDRSIATAEQVGAKRVFFTHICHDLAHARTEARLPPHIRLAYDGLEIEVGQASTPAAGLQTRPIRIFRTLDELPPDFGPSALTIGNFDGVHAGHRRILRRVKEVAAERGLKPSALTFDPHPSKIVAPARAPRLMTSPVERCALMQTEGIEQVFIMPFDQHVVQLTPEQFVEQVLVRKLDVRAMVLGHDFCFGYKQSGNVQVLRELGRKYGFTTEEVKAVTVRGRVVSSTALRQLIEAGRVAQAARLLERPYALEGDVVAGRGVGSKQTVPTLNLASGTEVLPATGVYVTRTRDLAAPRVWPSITNVGYRPTFADGRELSIETFLLDPLAGEPPRRIRVEFLWRVRDERQFPDAQSLKQQILRDAGLAQAYFRRVKKWTCRSDSPVDSRRNTL